MLFDKTQMAYHFKKKSLFQIFHNPFHPIFIISDKKFDLTYLYKLDGHWINAAIMSRTRTLSVSGGEWRSGLAWLLLNYGRVCRKTASPFDWQRFYKKSLTLNLFERSPIADFASLVERQTAATYFLVFAWQIASQFSSYISHNYTPPSLFQFNLILTFPPSLISF